METLGTARLTSELDPRRAVATSVARDDVAAILRDPDGQPELQLDIRNGDELSRISMAWTRNELEDLVARTPGDTIVLTFDRDELADALADVEAHGLRQKALVFSVAAAGALGSGIGIANASEYADVGGGAATSTVTSVGHRTNPDLGAQVSRGAELATTSSSSGEVFGIQAPDTAEAFLVGGILVAIAGATFAVRRTLPAKPA